MHVLGIDYGEKMVGVAISDGTYAQDLDSFATNEAIDRIVLQCQQYLIEQIVIGEGTGRLSQTIDSFGKKLAGLTKLPIIYWDETLTTARAQAVLLTNRSTRKRRRTKEHQVAAALILQSYLDSL